MRTLASWQGRFQVGLGYVVLLQGLSIFLFKTYAERFENPVPRLLPPLAGVQLSAEAERIQASQIPSITVTLPLRVGGVMLHHLVERLHLQRVYMGKGLVSLNSLFEHPIFQICIFVDPMHVIATPCMWIYAYIRTHIRIYIYLYIYIHTYIHTLHYITLHYIT